MELWGKNIIILSTYLNKTEENRCLVVINILFVNVKKCGECCYNTHFIVKFK